MRGSGATRYEATRLFDDGFTTLEEVAYVPFDELLGAMRGDATRATELRRIARETCLRDDA